ncbi:MAG TPA: hypothetical protein VMB26_08050 [Candidatus Binataceae bacterium]|nr:hypothetical protein [Candidatus Binataceae bacterium]
MHQVLISAGATDITPPRPLMLGGFDKRPRPFSNIASSLEANVLILTGRSSRVIIVSTDLLYPGQTLRDRLTRNLGLERNAAELFLCASHTHYAPMTAPAMPRLGVADPTYVGYVADQIASLIKSIEGQDAPAECSYREGMAHHSINRRLVRLRLTKFGLARSSRFGPNPLGERDESVRIVTFSNAAGAPLCVIWNYACHPTGFPDLLAVSAEYPGVVRARLRAEFGNIPIVFLQGFSGDVRPPFVGTPGGVIGLARRVLRGPQFRIPSRDEWEQWSSGLAECVASIARSPARPIELSAPKLTRTEIAEREFAAGGSGDKSLFWHTIDCGGFRIIGVNAEPVVEYRRLVEKYLNGTPFLTAGCLDQAHCYLPIDTMIPERGYEVDGFRPLLGFNAKFLTRLQDAVIGRLTKALS